MSGLALAGGPVDAPVDASAWKPHPRGRHRIDIDAKVKPRHPTAPVPDSKTEAKKKMSHMQIMEQHTPLMENVLLMLHDLQNHRLLNYLPAQA